MGAAVSNQQNKSNFIMTAINSIPIKSINDFVEFFKKNCELESIYLEGIDFNIFSGKLNSEAVDLDFNNSLLQKFIYMKSSDKWEIESLDLKQYCKSMNKPKEDEKNKRKIAKRESNSENNSNILESLLKEISNIDENLFNSKENGHT